MVIEFKRRKAMKKHAFIIPALICFLFGAMIIRDALGSETGLAIFNVKDYGATGKKAGSAQAAIQKAIDACAAAGGGMVYVPPGEY
jgi:hypothetical protein